VIYRRAGMSERLRALVPPARRWLVPLLLVGVASVQLARVSFGGQSRWRGGGFGMYSEFHPNRNQIWLRALDQPDAPPRRLSDKQGPPDRQRAVGRCLRLRAEACLRELAATLPPHPGRQRLEIWQPVFDARSGTLSRRRAAALDF
jgi:hypothetical protein